jgi:hypothetical protein
MVPVSFGVNPAHFVEASVDYLVDDDESFRVTDAEARAEG